MEKVYEFKCEVCKYSWLDNAKWPSRKSKEPDYQNGFECPKCAERNDISGKEVKQ